MALALPASVGAAGHFFQGSITTGGHVELHAKFHNHRASKVLTFAWDSVPVPAGPMCGGGAANGELDHAIDVNSKGKFDFTHSTNAVYPTTVNLAGDFNDQYTRVTGTLRIHGGISGGNGTDCDTGTLDWKAHP